MNSFFKPIYTFCWLLFLAPGWLLGQDRCYGFDDLPLEAVFGVKGQQNPQDTFLRRGNFDLQLVPFITANGEKEFLNLTVNSAKSTFNGRFRRANDKFIFVSNINLLATFPRAPERKAKQICIDFFDGGGEENIAVNGGEVLVVRNFLELQGKEIAKGVKISVSLDSTATDDFLPSGTLCLEGNITSLVLGGQELGLDNFCVTYDDDDNNSCRFSDFKAVPQPCTPNGIFYLDYGFTAQGGGSDGYLITVNDTRFGPFKYGSRFTPIGPITPNASGNYTVRVIDVEDNACQASFKIENWRCTAAPCTLKNLKAEVVFCSRDSSSYLKIDPASLAAGILLDSFRLAIDGQLVGFFNLRQLLTGRIDLPRKLYPNSQTRVVICSVREPNCCYEATLRLNFSQDCSAPNQCQLSNLVLSPRPCTSNDGSFLLDFKFAFQQAGATGYVVTVNDQKFGPYRYGTTFPALGPIRPNTRGLYEVRVTDLGTATCTVVGRFTWNCATGLCPLNDGIKPTLTFCPGHDSVARLRINLPPSPLPVVFLDSFAVKINGKLLGYFNLRQLADTIAVPASFLTKDKSDDDEDDDNDDDEDNGEDDSDDDDHYYREIDLVICALRRPDCCFEAEVEVQRGPDCIYQDTCRLSELTVRPVDCSANGSFFLKTDFEHHGPAGKGYQIVVNGFKFGPYRYGADRPVVGPIRPDSQGYYLVEVVDLDTFGCRDTAILKDFRCPPCPEVVATGYFIPCKNPWLILTAKAGTAVDTSFVLLVNGKKVGVFALGKDLRIKLDDDFGGNPALKIQVCLARFPNCCFETVFYPSRLPCPDDDDDDDDDDDKEDCLEFEDLPANAIYSAETGYKPGARIFTENGVNAFIEAAEDASRFGKIGVVKNPDPNRFPQGKGQSLVLANAAVRFDFSNLKGVVRSLCFDFFNASKVNVVAINGKRITLSQLSTAPLDSLFGDLDISVSFSTRTTAFGLESGSVCIKGRLESFAIGGTELLIDNVCFDLDDDLPQCQLDLGVKAVRCDPVAGRYYAQIVVKTSGSTKAYQVKGPDGKLYGPYKVGQDAPVIGPFILAPFVPRHPFVAFDAEYPACTDSVLLTDIACDTAAYCWLQDIKAKVESCTPRGNLNLLVNLSFGPLLSNSATFYLRIEGKEYGPYRYNALPVLVEGVVIGAANNAFEVTAFVKGTKCSVSTKLERPLCPPFFPSCFNFDNLTRGSYGRARGQQPGDLIYLENGLALRLASFRGPTATSPEFFNELSVIPASEKPSFRKASGNFLFHQQIASTFSFREYPQVIQKITLDYLHSGGLFAVAVNGGQPVYWRQPDTLRRSLGNGTVAYLRFSANEPFTGQLIIEGRTISSLTVGGEGFGVDNLCIEKKTDPCSLRDLVVRDLKCAADGKTYSLVLNLIPGSADSIFYLRTGSGFEYKFRRSDLPLRLEGIPVGNNRQETIKVCSSNTDDCCATTTYEVPCASGVRCLIRAVKAEVKNCTPQGNYNVVVNLDLEPGAPPTGDFYLSIEGKTYGPFVFGKLPVLLENVVIFTDALTFEVAAFQRLPNVDCRFTTQVRKPVCPPTFCSITDIKVSDLRCDNNTGTSYSLTLNLQAKNTDSVLVLTTSTGKVFRVPVRALPLRLSGIPIPANSRLDFFTICSSNQRDCCAKWQYELPCLPAACELGPLKVAQVCQPNGSYYLTLNFEHKNTSGSFFASFNGQKLGQYRYSSLPLRLGPFPNPRPGSGELVIEDAEKACRQAAKVALEFCGTSCNIKEVSVRALPCVGGSYQAQLLVSSQAADAGKYFLVFVEGELFGPYQYGQRLPEFGPFKADGVSTYNFLVVDQANPTCYGFANLGPQRCAIEPCAKGKLEVTALRCNPDGSRRLRINFPYAGTTAREFRLWIDGKELGVFPLSKLPLEESFKIPGSSSNQDRFKVRVCLVTPDAASACCFEAELIMPCRAGASSEVWPGDANHDNIANHIDLIHIGVAYGYKGAGRQFNSPVTASRIEWVATPAADWVLSFPNGLNFKHADCNGDGTVDEQDIEILRRNYGLTHGARTRPDTLPATDLDPDISLDWDGATKNPQSGDVLNLPIVLGTAQKRVKDIYGVAFELKVDPSKVDLSRVQVVVPSSWLGQPKVNLEYIYKVYPERGVIEMAFTRIDQNEVSGYGPIAHLRIIKDDIVGRQATTMQVQDPRAIQMDGVELPLGVKTLVIPAATDPVPADFRPVVEVYPNPASAQVQVRTSLPQPIERLQVFGLDGRAVTPAALNTSEITVGSLSSGVYILQIQVGNAVFHERLVRE